EKAKIYETVEAGISYVVNLKELSSSHVLLDLSLKKEDVERLQKDKDGILVRGRTLQILRKIEIGKLERFVLENDGKDQPASWVEMSVIRDSKNQHIPSHGPAPLPFSADGPGSAEKESLTTELQGVWRPVKMERGGAPVRGAD